jgi:hypothetical protein
MRLLDSTGLYLRARTDREREADEMHRCLLLVPNRRARL